MIALFLVQCALPLILICGMALVPPRSLSGFCLQAVAIAAALWAMALLGIWLLPPWWAPPAFGLGLAAATWVGLGRRQPFESAMPATGAAWTVAAIFAALGVASAYGIYGARVLAPCTGQVLMAVDGLPDMQVPEVDREHLAGNHALLRCVDAEAQADVLLGHLRPGSVRVRPGDTVAVGDWLGSVGNSGNTGEPHLHVHVHAQRAGPVGTPLAGDPLPVLFENRFPVRGDRIHSP